MAKIISLLRHKKRKKREKHGDDMHGKLEILAEIEAEEKRIRRVNGRKANEKGRA
jgi:hypothetical protein